jgi:hypothetical protein
MSQHAPPSTDCSPQCGRCHLPMCLAMEIPQVSEPGRVQIFECAGCGNVEFRLTLPAEHHRPNTGTV